MNVQFAMFPQAALPAVGVAFFPCPAVRVPPGVSKDSCLRKATSLSLPDRSEAYPSTGFNDAKRRDLSTINTNSDLSFSTIQQQTYSRKQLMDQSDDKSLTALLTKRDPERFREIVNTCSERRVEKRIQRTA